MKANASTTEHVIVGYERNDIPKNALTPVLPNPILVVSETREPAPRRPHYPLPPHHTRRRHGDHITKATPAPSTANPTQNSAAPAISRIPPAAAFSLLSPALALAVALLAPDSCPCPLC